VSLTRRAAGGGEPLATDSDGLGCRFRGGLSHLSAGSHSVSQVGGGESENSGVEWSPRPHLRSPGGLIVVHGGWVDGVSTRFLVPRFLLTLLYTDASPTSTSGSHSRHVVKLSPCQFWVLSFKNRPR
jgi:hypothetical protein